MSPLPLFDAPSGVRPAGLVSRYDTAPAAGVKPPSDFSIGGAKEIRFNGDAYDPEKDLVRLTGQILRIFESMKDGRWRTLSEIEAATGDPQASISAQLRHLRKDRFGSHTVDRRHRGEREHGLFEYRLVVRVPSVRTSAEGLG